MWRNFRFQYMTNVEKSEISPRVEEFQIFHTTDYKYEVCVETVETECTARTAHTACIACTAHTTDTTHTALSEHTARTAISAHTVLKI